MSADNVGSCIHLDIDDALDSARDQLTLGVAYYSTTRLVQQVSSVQSMCCERVFKIPREEKNIKTMRTFGKLQQSSRA